MRISPVVLSNKPIRRIARGGLGSYSGQLGTPVYIMGQLVDAQILTADQIQDVISRHPEVPAMQTATPPSGSWAIGYSFNDPVYGNVLISLDASNRWQFVGGSPIAPAVINAPPYQSPLGDPNCDWLCQLNKGLGTAEVIALGIGGLLLWSVLKK